MWWEFIITGVLSWIFLRYWAKWAKSPKTVLLNRKLPIGGIVAALASIITLAIFGSWNAELLVYASVLLLAGIAGLANDFLLPLPANLLFLLVPIPLIAAGMPWWQGLVILATVYLSNRWHTIDGADSTSLLLTATPLTLIALEMKELLPGTTGLAVVASLLVLWWWSKPPATVAAGRTIQSVAGTASGLLIVSTQAWWAAIVFLPHLADALLNGRAAERTPYVQKDRTLAVRNRISTFQDVIITALRATKGTVYPFDLLFFYTVVQSLISGTVLAVYLLI